MQTCSYCGKEHEDGASHCRECATELEAGTQVRNVREAKEAAVTEPGGSVRSGLSNAAMAVAFLALVALVVWQLLREKRLMAESASLRHQLAPLREENKRLAQWIRKAAAAAELQPLQGTWEGAESPRSVNFTGQESESARKITLTIAGNSLHFYRDTNHWFDTTFTLPPSTVPQQLHATIKGAPESWNAIGQVVFAIFKIVDGTLTLSGIPSRDEKPPESSKVFDFEDKEMFHYEFRKVPPQKRNTEPPTSK